MASSHSSDTSSGPSAGGPAGEDHVDRIQAEWRRERPDVDLAPQAAIARLHRVANTLTARLVEVYRRHSLSEGEFDVLCALRRAGTPYARQPAELARATVVTTGGLTKRLDALERRGLVVREVSAEDGRAKIARLTPAGRELIDAAFTAHMDNEAELISALSAGDRAEMERILRAWQTALDGELSTVRAEARSKEHEALGAVRAEARDADDPPRGEDASA